MIAHRIIPLVLGRLHLELGLMTYRLNYGVREWLPIVAWYIEGPQEHILVDSGISAADMAWYTDTPSEDLQTFEEALARVGRTPDDIDLVIQTHLHCDHVGNTPRCTRAKVVVQRSELAYAQAPHPMQGYLYNPEVLRGLRFQVVEGDREIVPGVEVIHLPSHTPGTQAVSVTTRAGRAVISGMCCIGQNFAPPKPAKWPQQRHWWEVTPPGNFLNLYEAFDSTLRLKGLADILLPQHDPSLFQITEIPAPEGD
ncbi:MAG: N-acyl homoserine lactonase family protein [Deltaproteobacteria bacterium]|nr:N-acyl homoserine lactonase family protein [Deltaproteobacteria bacterium]